MLTPTQEAIISTLHVEPHYVFLQNERKSALRMIAKGLLKTRTDKAEYSDSYTQRHPPKGLRCKVTAKGEKAFKAMNDKFWDNAFKKAKELEMSED